MGALQHTTTICTPVTQELWRPAPEPLCSLTSGDSPKAFSSILSGEGLDETERGESLFYFE
jgi:hypothetical protein